MILLPAETLGRKQNHTDSLCRKLFTKHNSLGRKQEIPDSLGGSQIGQTISAGSENQRTRLYPVLISVKYSMLKFGISGKDDISCSKQ